jgi:hypothetical protein
MPTKTKADLVKDAAKNIMTRLHNDMQSEMEMFTENKSLPKEEVDAGVFLVLDAYQTACMSMIAYLNDLRSSTGRKAQKIVCHDGEDIVSPSDGTMN